MQCSDALSNDFRNGCQKVVAQVENPERSQQGYFLGDGRDLIVGHVQLFQHRKLHAERSGNAREAVSVQTQHLQVVQACQERREFGDAALPHADLLQAL